MNVMDFESSSLVTVMAIFAVAAGVVWFAGSRLSRYADALAKRTGTADVVVGTLLLGGVTSLPEVVTTIAASSQGDADIAINNLFGGVALQVTILAIGDAFVKKRSITSLIASPVVQLQAMVGIVLLVTAAVVVLVGDASVGHLGFGSILILILFVSGFYIINYFHSIDWWATDPEQRDGVRKVRRITESETHPDSGEARKGETETPRSFARIVKTRLFLYLILAAAAILVAGYTVVQTGQAIASKTGLGSSLVGAVLVALATSLPEVSTTISAVRMQEYRLAFSNILGTNIFTVGFVFLADVFYTDGPVLSSVDQISILGAMLGVLLTAIYVIGLSVRYKKTFLGLGYDSILVVLGYLAGVSVMVMTFNK